MVKEYLGPNTQELLEKIFFEILVNTTNEF